MESALMAVTEPRETRLIADLALDSMVMLDSLTSPASNRACRRDLRDFVLWYRNTGQTVLHKAVVQRYAAELREQGKSAHSINQRLSALASEAADMGYIPQDIAAGIQILNGIRATGISTGNRLAKQQAQEVLDSPKCTIMKGASDRAILAVLVGCGLRRNEAAHLAFDHVQMRESRWVILDWHRVKAGTIEHVHHIIKSELGGGVYPSGKHGANAAWLRLQVITHNLLQMLKAAVLPKEYANAEPKRLRFAVFTGLGQIVHHARRVILKILEELWATLIRAAQERALALSPPVC